MTFFCEPLVPRLCLGTHCTFGSAIDAFSSAGHVFYAKGVLGAGCVKAQAACGAWIGAGLTLSTCIEFVLISSVVAAIAATVCSVVFAIKQKNAQQVTLEHLGEEQSGFNLPLMHGQLPLSLGTIFGVVVASLF